MNAFAFILLAAVVLADDCGHFQCPCSASNELDMYDLITDETRKPVKFVRYHNGYSDSKCESEEMYSIVSEFQTTFDSTSNITHIYNRKLASTKLVIKKEEALTTLQCTGVKVGDTLDLMNEEEKVKCTAEVLNQFINTEAEGKLDITIIDTKMNNPNVPNEQCLMLHVDDCFVVYPSRGLLYAMYSLALTMLVTTIVIYTLFVFGKSNTLPVTQPKETEMVAQPAAEKSAQPAQPAQPTVDAETPAQPAAEESAQPAQPAQPTVDAETPAQPTPTTENQVEL